MFIIKSFLFLNQRKVLGNQMMSEKKNKYPTPESVAMDELKNASKENMNLVRTVLWTFWVCAFVERRKLIRFLLAYCVSLGHSTVFNCFNIQQFDFFLN